MRTFCYDTVPAWAPIFEAGFEECHTEGFQRGAKTNKQLHMDLWDGRLLALRRHHTRLYWPETQGTIAGLITYLHARGEHGCLGIRRADLWEEFSYS